MPNLTEIATAAIENVASATINYGVSTIIAPIVGPVGAALAPQVFSVAAHAIATSATSSIITYGLFSSGKAIINTMQVDSQNHTKKPFNEEWDDTDIPMTAKV